MSLEELMSVDKIGSLASIIGLVLAIVGLFFGGKYLINKNKKTCGDDNSIKIGDKNTIKDSFNREK